MKISEMRCDVCGAALEPHGDRYVVSMSRLPVIRGVGRKETFDLCKRCAARMKVRLGRRDGYMDVKPDV